MSFRILKSSSYLTATELNLFSSRNNFELFRNHTVAITGANGMIGSALATLIYAGAESNGFSCKKLILISRSWENSALKFLINNPNVEVFENTELPKSIAPEIIFHLASPSNSTKYSNYEELSVANIQIASSLLSKNTNQVIYTSTGEVYGSGETEEDTVLPAFRDSEFRSLYPIAKITSENSLLEMSKKYAFEAKIVRLFHTFGPGVKCNDGRSFADILWGGFLDKKIILKSDGSQVRSFLYITDAIDALLKIMNENSIEGKRINVGSEIKTSILDFARIASDLMAVPIEFENRVNSNFMHSPNQILLPSIERLKLLGWEQTVSLAEGIQSTLRWIKDQNQA